MEPEQKFSVKYSFSRLEKVKDTITIIGLSPNNDSHIMKSIRENQSINFIVFYYFQQQEIQIVTEIFKNNKVSFKDVNNLWI